MPSQSYSVRANSAYRLGAPKLDDVTVIAHGEHATAALAFEAGEVDIAAGDADMFLQAWVTTPQGDPGAVLETLLKTDGGSNAGGYSNEALVALLTAGRQTFEHAARKEIYDQVQTIIAEDGAMIPVFHVSQVNVAKPGLTGYAVHPIETYWINHETAFEK